MALAKRQAGPSSGFEKKHDLPYHSQSWQPSSRMRTWLPFRKRRAFLAVVIFLTIYLFVKYLPTDVPSVGDRIDPRTGQAQGLPFFSGGGQKKTHNGETQSPSSDQVYDGPVKFYNLASSLRIHVYNKDPDRDNLVFLLYDLRSASTLIPLACEFALYNKSAIHMGVLSRQDVAIEEIISISGIQQEDCPIFWHDARPNYNSQSSKARQVNVIKSSVSHLHAALTPTAFILNEQQAEDKLFNSALTERLASLWVPSVTVPNNALNSANWITSLDAKGVALLRENQIDIVIIPYKHSAGSLMRLLNSIRLTDYTGFPLPRITVELPHDIDNFALHWLENFRWPSSRRPGESKLILRRRIDTAQLTPAVASLRTLESFYPPSSPQSHVLILSPDVELSPNYLHYLIYLTLEYKYSRASQYITASLMGISLNLPDKALDDESSFVVREEQSASSLLLSQSPSSIATLYFGDKWVELQDYLSLRLKHDPTLSQTINQGSQVSSKHPSWLKQASELMQARNYYMLYPAFASSSRLVTVHSELHQNPEEFADLFDQDQNAKDAAASKIPLAPSSYGEGKVLTSLEDNDLEMDSHANMGHEQQSSAQSRSLLSLLGLEGYQSLPAAYDLPLFSAQGEMITPLEAEEQATTYAKRLSLEVGGCATVEDRDEKKLGRVGHLFCDAN